MKVGVSHSNPQYRQTIASMVGKLKGGAVKIGFPAGKEGLGTPHYEDGASIMQVAIWNQFGTGIIPSRPFMTMAKDKLRAWYPGFIKDSAANLESFNVSRVLNLIGEYGKGQIQIAITELQDPPNAPYTIKKKKSAKPLIDTGAMRQSVTYLVEE